MPTVLVFCLSLPAVFISWNAPCSLASWGLHTCCSFWKRAFTPPPLNTLDKWYSPFKSLFKSLLFRGTCLDTVICSLAISFMTVCSISFLYFPLWLFVQCLNLLLYTVSAVGRRTVSAWYVNILPGWNRESTAQIFLNKWKLLFGEIIWIRVICNPCWGK